MPDERPIQPDRNPDNPLSDAPVTIVHLDGGGILRIDGQGRVLCKAKRRDGELCMSPVVAGLRVCRMHGARAPGARAAAKQRLADLVDPAIEKLSQIIDRHDTKDPDRLRAIDSVLDRTGHGRSQTVDTSNAKERLFALLMDKAADDGATEGSIEEPDWGDA